MSNILSSTDPKTLNTETKNLFQDNISFSTLIDSKPQKITLSPFEKLNPVAKSVKTDGLLKLPPPQIPKIPNQNTVIIDGVKVQRAMPQETLQYHTEAQLKGLGLEKFHYYIDDNFSTKNQKIGYGNTMIAVSHGELVAASANAEFHGKVEIFKLDSEGIVIENKIPVMRSSVNIEISNLKSIFINEAKMQNTTIDKVDLSYVIVNRSSGSSGISLDPTVTALYEKITKHGGQVSQSAGNDSLNTECEVGKGMLIADGSNEYIGDKNSSNPKPATFYRNNSLTADGKDNRQNRKIDPTSESRIAPSKLLLRVNDKGDVEFKNIEGWTKFIDKTNTVAVKPTEESSVSGFEGNKITSEMTAADYEKLDIWCDEKKLNGKIIPAKTADEISSEIHKKYGKTSVISLEEFMDYFRRKPKGLSELSYEFIMATLGKGISPKNIYIPFEKAFINSVDLTHIDLPFFTKSKDGQLKSFAKAGTLLEGTSFAAPALGSENIIAQAIFVKQTFENRAKPNVRTKLNP